LTIGVQLETGIRRHIQRQPKKGKKMINIKALLKTTTAVGIVACIGVGGIVPTSAEANDKKKKMEQKAKRPKKGQYRVEVRPEAGGYHHGHLTHAAAQRPGPWGMSPAKGGGHRPNGAVRGRV
jgi:hypothetical protein